MKILTTVLAASLLVGTTASADGNEFLTVLNTSVTNSNFVMLSYRRALDASGEGPLKFGIDASRSDWDQITGTGSLDSGRLALSYTLATSASAEVTLTGGLSQRMREPAGTSETGFFVSGELYSKSRSGNTMFLLAEFDSVDETMYASAQYMFDVGSFRVGPSVNYITEGNYSRSAGGVSASFDLSAKTQLELTAAWAEQDTGFGSPEDASYVEMRLSTSF